jgi:predicted MFS family arabinose efflux permease
MSLASLIRVPFTKNLKVGNGQTEMPSMNSSTHSAAPAPFPRVPLLWMALGTFAVGTEGFMIAPLLPDIASDLLIDVNKAGLLVTIFALAYAVSSPVLTTLTARAHRRWLLIVCMAGFAVANVVAWSSGTYGGLMTARILIALAAGLYVPNANALASAIVSPGQRGRALAVINAGTTTALVFGLPIGQMIGARLGWRMTFAGVALLALCATVGLIIGLPRSVGSALPIAAWRERLDVARQPAVLLALLVTTLWATGAYTVYTYFAVYLKVVTGIGGMYVGLVFLLWGVCAAAGVFIGGALNDRLGARSVILPSLAFVGLAFLGLFAADALSRDHALGLVLACVVAWGIGAWAFFPAQQARLIGFAGLKAAPIVLSLNASFMFIGFSLGSAIGAVIISVATPADLGWVGALFELSALLLVFAGHHVPASADRGDLAFCSTSAKTEGK